MQVLVSVIIPIYNVEDYIRRCLESIIEQSYENLQIILVDDGSPDNCGIICDEYAKSDKRIEVIHQKNQGLSAARNAGLNVAKGDYISFIDSDDVVSNDYIESMIYYIDNEKTDIVIGSYCQFSDNIIFDKYSSNFVVRKYNSYNALKDLAIGKLGTSAWAKLIKTDLFNEVKFPVGKLYEDLDVTYKLFYKAKQLVYINKVIYGYFIRDNSIMHTKWSKKSLDSLEIRKKRYLFFDASKQVELKDLFLYSYVVDLISQLEYVKLYLEDEYILNKIKNEIQKYFHQILKSKYVSKMKKIQLLFYKNIPFKSKSLSLYLACKKCMLNFYKYVMVKRNTNKPKGTSIEA